MNPVYIKASLKVLLKHYLKAYLLFTPLLLIFLFTESPRVFITFLGIAYYVPLTVLLIIEMIRNRDRTLIEMTEKGITLNKQDFYEWDHIYEFRIIHKTVKTRTQRRGTTVRKKNLIRINEENYNFHNRYLEFTPEELFEVISIYRDRIGILQIEDRTSAGKF
ncbi:hypothetical protein H1R16_09920 [Marnyiella aurantia]|uniref:Uncharacterized protein n=1 Tax=Marnyiella aurantia TaxID=2758037 RepID=A0A7D7QEB9_9FLAO|nr:hypothetical protein [Marnyiella aurantia]MBA5246624.1 hypothetical protein [Marnyiella aurantia]QMS98021.1 hypothetical protein H1R16_09920 [Marnyiella aurantia]